MGDEMTSDEVTTESVQLSQGMLGIIGAYGMHSALDVRDLDRRTARESAAREHGLPSADGYASASAAAQASL
jgi:hypothetical protein